MSETAHVWGMEAGDGPRTLRLRVPVSDGYWRDYGASLGFVLAALVVLAVVLARDPGDGLVVAGVFLGLSAGAVLAGLAVYNVVVAAAMARKR